MGNPGCHPHGKPSPALEITTVGACGAAGKNAGQMPMYPFPPHCVPALEITAVGACGAAGNTGQMPVYPFPPHCVHATIIVPDRPLNRFWPNGSWKKPWTFLRSATGYGVSYRKMMGAALI